jgi:hypothetical protein
MILLTSVLQPKSNPDTFTPAVLNVNIKFICQDLIEYAPILTPAEVGAAGPVVLVGGCVVTVVIVGVGAAMVERARVSIPIYSERGHDYLPVPGRHWE